MCFLKYSSLFLALFYVCVCLPVDVCACVWTSSAHFDLTFPFNVIKQAPYCPTCCQKYTEHEQIPEMFALFTKDNSTPPRKNRFLVLRKLVLYVFRRVMDSDFLIYVESYVSYSIGFAFKGSCDAKTIQQHSWHFKTTANVLVLEQINIFFLCFFDKGLSQSSERTSARYYSARETVSESTASHSVGRWSAHLRSECETHVNVWVGVKRIEERVSMSQYENAHVCPSAGTFNKACTPTVFFFPSSCASLWFSSLTLFLSLTSLPVHLSQSLFECVLIYATWNKLCDFFSLVCISSLVRFIVQTQVRG